MRRPDAFLILFTILLSFSWSESLKHNGHELEQNCFFHFLLQSLLFWIGYFLGKYRNVYASNLNLIVLVKRSRARERKKGNNLSLFFWWLDSIVVIVARLGYALGTWGVRKLLEWDAGTPSDERLWSSALRKLRRAFAAVSTWKTTRLLAWSTLNAPISGRPGFKSTRFVAPKRLVFNTKLRFTVFQYIGIEPTWDLFIHLFFILVFSSISQALIV